MATTNERLATALEALTAAERGGILQHDAISERYRKLLKQFGFIREIMRGWYHVANPQLNRGDTTWFASYWEFIRQYMKSRFGENYCLSAESSLLLHAGSSTIPNQLILLARSKGSVSLKLRGGLSILVYQDVDGFPEQTSKVRDLNVMTLAESLVRVPEGFYRNRPEDASVVLRTVADSSPILGLLLRQGKSVVAKRLAGAFRANHQPEIADEIISTMRRAGYETGETNPFERLLPQINVSRNPSPYEVRVRTIWSNMREKVAACLPAAPGLPIEIEAYMRRTDDLYGMDAYNSLSIEGYRVTPELVEQVRGGNWNPQDEDADRQNRDALAARGYYEASLAVRTTVREIISGASVNLVRRVHRDWHQALFAPSVAVGLLQPSDLAGYRNHPVFINGSQHVPPPSDGVVDAMATLFDMIEGEPEASVRAVLGHFMFVFIHPYGDGNGRIGRFLMNAMFASGGYDWTVIPVQSRSQYMEALEKASVNAEIEPFAQFVALQLTESRKALG